MLFWKRKSCRFCNVFTDHFRLEYLDDNIAIFHDIRPASKIHLLAIPRKHIPSIKHLKKSDIELLKELESKTRYVLETQAHLKGKVENESKIIIGFHTHYFTSIDHLHLHILVPPFKRFTMWKYQSNFIWFSSLHDVIEKLSSR